MVERGVPGSRSVLEIQALVVEVHGALQLVRITRHPLGQVPVLMIRQKGWTA
jgi:hypothetical protein